MNFYLRSCQRILHEYFPFRDLMLGCSSKRFLNSGTIYSRQVLFFYFICILQTQQLNEIYFMSLLIMYSHSTIQYEMERGKLEMELEEERKSRNQWISEQQKKIENSSTTSFSVSDCGTNNNQVHLIRNEIIKPVNVKYFLILKQWQICATLLFIMVTFVPPDNSYFSFLCCFSDFLLSSFSFPLFAS